jgi:L-ascorbate metabolism protein UlaG (beta-lactamase superfamily)
MNPDIPMPSDRMTSTTVTYLGTNTLLFRKGRSCLLIDPHFSRPGLLQFLGKIAPDTRRISAGLRAFNVGRGCPVVLTHTHYDHALDAVEVVRQTGGILVGSKSVQNLALGAGFAPAKFLAPGMSEPVMLERFEVRFHPGRHLPFPPPLGWALPGEGEIEAPLRPPAWMWDYQCGRTSAIQVDRVLILGSAGFIPGAYRNLDIDTVILSVGGLETRPAAYLRRLFEETVLVSGASRVLISHWDDFFGRVRTAPRPLGLAGFTIGRLKKMGAQWNLPVQKLPYGKPVIISHGD